MRSNICKHIHTCPIPLQSSGGCLSSHNVLFLLLMKLCLVGLKLHAIPRNPERSGTTESSILVCVSTFSNCLLLTLYFLQHQRHQSHIIGIPIGIIMKFVAMKIVILLIPRLWKFIMRRNVSTFVLLILYRYHTYHQAAASIRSWKSNSFGHIAARQEKARQGSINYDWCVTWNLLNVLSLLTYFHST